MFSKYDVYTTVQSMYCYPDTDVLINKLNIRDKAELKQAEEEFTAVKQMALLQEPIKGRFTKTHLFRIHRFLFEDVYPFAGHIRKEQISKGDTMFYPPDLIDRELERVFKNIHSKKLLAEQDEEKQIQNVEIQKTGIKDFDRYAKRYHIDYAIQKDLSCTPPRYLIYFKAQDTDALSAAFKEYSASVLDKTKRPSVLAKLHDLAQSVASLPDKVRNKQEERSL